MSKKSRVSLTRSPPITRYFCRIGTTNKENVMPPKRNDAAARKRGRIEVSLGKEKRQPDCTSKAPPVTITPDVPPLSPCAVICVEPASFEMTKPLAPRKRDFHSLSGYDSDLEIIDETPLDKTRLPTWLQSPSISSSDNSDDDLLKPVTFTNSRKVSEPDAALLEKSLKFIKLENEEKVSTALNKLHESTSLTPELTPKLTPKDERVFSDTKDKVASPISVMIPTSGDTVNESPMEPSTAKECSHSSRDEKTKTQVPLLEEERLRIMTEDLTYDTKPPYTKELELLILTNGALPLSCHAKDTITLFSQNQRETIDMIPGLSFLSLSQRVCDSMEYLMMITSFHCMIPAESLIILWDAFITTEEPLPDAQVTRQIVQYFQYLVSCHQPGQHRLIRKEYSQFVQGISQSVLLLLLSKERWKVELLSIIVGLLLSDYHHWSANDQPHHNSDSDESPLFHCLFWKPNEYHFITSQIRHLMQSAVEIYRSTDQGYLQMLKMGICAQLFFLIFTECESIASDLSIALSSLSSLQIFTALLTYTPLKLRDSICRNVDIKEPITSRTHDSVKVCLIANSILKRHC